MLDLLGFESIFFDLDFPRPIVRHWNRNWRMPDGLPVDRDQGSLRVTANNDFSFLALAASLKGYGKANQSNDRSHEIVSLIETKKNLSQKVQPICRIECLDSGWLPVVEAAAKTIESCLSGR